MLGKKEHRNPDSKRKQNNAKHNRKEKKSKEEWERKKKKFKFVAINFLPFKWLLFHSSLQSKTRERNKKIGSKSNKLLFTGVF